MKNQAKGIDDSLLHLIFLQNLSSFLKDKILKKVPVKPIFIFPLAVFVVIIVLTALKLHGSSIGMYNIYFNGESKDPFLLLGSPREIRSDEWLVQTPWSLSETADRLDQSRSQYVGAHNLTMTDVPIGNWTMFFKPDNWSFLILPEEYAFSFKWWFRGGALLITTYIVVMKLTKRNILVSILSSIAFFYSPYFQWWYSTSIVDTCSYAFLIFFFFLKMFHAKKILELLVFGTLFTYFSICLVFLFYPPSQIPVALFFVFLGIGYLFANRRQVQANQWKRFVFTIGTSLFAIGIVGCLFYISFSREISAMTNTIYPGVRNETGGTLPIQLLLDGFYNSQLVFGSRAIPPIFGNQSEGASFFMFSFFLLPIYIFSVTRSFFMKEHVDAVLVSAITFFLFILVYCIWGLPSIVSKLFLLSNVPARRMLIVFGVVNLFLIIYFLSRFKIEVNFPLKIFSTIYAIIIFIIYWSLGNGLRATNPGYISALKITLISLFVAVMMILLIFQKKEIFLLLFLAFSLYTTFSVNPVYRGLDPLLNSDLSKAVRRLDSQNGTHKKWVVYQNFVMGNYLSANGAVVLSGTYLYPDLSLWQQFDPQEKHIDIYNRYSHVIFGPTESSNAKITLLNTDTVGVEINPCSQVLDKLGVGYHLFTYPVDNKIYACLNLVEHIDNQNMDFYIYQRSDKTTATPESKGQD